MPSVHVLGCSALFRALFKSMSTLYFKPGIYKQQRKPLMNEIKVSINRNGLLSKKITFKILILTWRATFAVPITSRYYLQEYIPL
jgi:hypothetical protein